MLRGKAIDPFTDAPNLSQIFNEDETDWTKTSLKGPIDFFNKYVNQLVKDEGKEKRLREEKTGLEF